MSTYTFPSEVIEQAFQKFQATLSLELKARLNGRLERGLAIVQSGGVSAYSEPGQAASQHLYRVRSSDPTNPPYLVDLHARSCTCPDHWKGHLCKHRIAASIINLAISMTRVDPPPVQVPAMPTASLQPSNPVTSKESIIWGVIRLNGELLGVEVLSIADEEATVRALPKIIDGKKLEPRFPFEGKHNTTSIPTKELFHVKIFQ